MLFGISTMSLYTQPCTHSLTRTHFDTYTKLIFATSVRALAIQRDIKNIVFDGMHTIRTHAHTHTIWDVEGFPELKTVYTREPHDAKKKEKERDFGCMVGGGDKRAARARGNSATLSHPKLIYLKWLDCIHGILMWYLCTQSAEWIDNEMIQVYANTYTCNTMRGSEGDTKWR